MGSLMYRLSNAARHVDDRSAGGLKGNGGFSTLTQQAAGALRRWHKEKPNSEHILFKTQADSLDLAMDVIFTGDALFSGGCGACFEGSELDTKHCFATLLSECRLDDALLFPGHEYTQHLLDMRMKEVMEEWVAKEPPGQFFAFCSAYYVASHRRALRDKVPTVPVTLANERLLNPYFD